MPRRNRSAENTLVLTDSAVPNIFGVDSASSVLTLTDAATVQHLIKTVDDTLILTGTVVTNKVLYIDATNDLNIQGTVTRDGTLNVECGNSLALNQIARSLIRGEFPSHSLDLQQAAVARRPFSLTVLSELGPSAADLVELTPIERTALEAIVGLRHNVSVKTSISNLSVTSYFSLSQQGAKTLPATASSHLHLSATSRPILYEQPTHYLRLQQLVVVDTVQGVEGVLELEQEALVAGVLVKVAVSTLSLQDVCSYTVVNFCDYTPGIGAGSFDIAPPTHISPTLLRRSTTVLTWPYSAPTFTLELRNPNLDNVEQFNFQRINRRTLGGQLDLYRDEDWPKNKKLIYSFSALSTLQREGLFVFLIKSLGQEVGILDFESRQWRGLILTPSSQVSQPREHNVSLEFEGELV